MGTRALTGNDSGCSDMLPFRETRVFGNKQRAYLATSQIRPTRSLSVSPSPRMPPEQTLIPASRTAPIVPRRSSYDRVVITSNHHKPISGTPKNDCVPRDKTRGRYPNYGYRRSIHWGNLMRRSLDEVINSRFLELLGLLGRKHAQCCANLHTHSPDFTDHGQDFFKAALAASQISPGSTHTEPCASVFLCFASCLEHGFDIDEF